MSMIEKYQDCVNLWETRRGKATRKPLKKFAYLVREEDGSFLFQYQHYNNTQGPALCRITADNKLVWLADNDTAWRFTHSLSSAMHNYLPLVFENMGRRVFRLGNPYENEYAEIHEGLMYDLTTGIFVNPKPPLMDRVNPDVRREWLRDLKRFNKHIRVLGKMGVLETLADDLSTKYKNQNYSERSTARKQAATGLLDRVVDAVRTGTVPNAVVCDILFVQGLPWAYSQPNHGAEIVKQFMNRNSIDLRRVYGVFNDE